MQLTWFSHCSYGNSNGNHSHVLSFTVFKGRNLGYVHYQLEFANHFNPLGLSFFIYKTEIMKACPSNPIPYLQRIGFFSSGQARRDRRQNGFDLTSRLCDEGNSLLVWNCTIIFLVNVNIALLISNHIAVMVSLTTKIAHREKGVEI